MSFVELPNIPSKLIELVLIDGRINPEIENRFNEMKIKVIKTTPIKDLYEAISYHPDMMLCQIDSNTFVYTPQIEKKIITELKMHGFICIQGKAMLQSKYPFNISYNVAIIGKKAFHNTKYTDEVIKIELQKRQIQLIHVNQGYSKCSICIVDENTIITQDKGIYEKAVECDIDALLIEANQHILLKGMNYGFIGGSTGLIGKKMLAITGDASQLVSFNEIRAFLDKKNIKMIYLSNSQVEDVGSILPLTY